MDMNKPSQPWLVNKLTAALQNRSSSYKNTKGSNNEMTHSEEDYIPVLKDEDCPPPIPSRRNQPGKPNTNISTRSSPIPAHRAPAKPSYQQDPQELYVEPNDNTSTASGPPVPPSRPPQTLPPFDPDEDYIEPDVEMHQPIKRTLPAIPNQQSKISPIINQREQCRIPTVPKREKSPIPKAESIPPSKPTSNKPVKRGVIPPPPTAKAVNGAKFGIDKPASPLNLRKHMQPSPQSIESYPWYHKNTSRQQAEPKFKNFNTDGAYIVRDSTQQNQPYTLMAFKASETKVYNLPVRRRPDNMYALGGEKRDEVTFKTVPDMIEHFLQNTLIVGSATEVRLSVPLPK